MATLVVPNNHTDSIKKTIEQANTGDTILVKNGIYHEQIIISINSIILHAVGNNVILNGEKLIDCGIVLKDVQNIEIMGFKVQNYKQEGIYIENGGNHKVINNIFVNIGKVGINILKSNNNLIYNNTLKGSYKTGIVIDHHADNNCIISNTIYSIGNNGVIIRQGKGNTVINNNIIP